MADRTAEPVRFHLDPRCPWCWQTSVWVRRLHDLGVVEASWGVFCLEIQNFTKPLAEFDVNRCTSAPALRTLVAIRDAGEESADGWHGGQAAAGRFYAALGRRFFDMEQPLDQVFTLEGALDDAGLDTGWLERAVEDPDTWETVLVEHDALVAETRSFGVPTIRLDGGTGPAIFGPVISNPPVTDAEAIELWEHVAWLTRYENFSELKRDRTIPPDLAYIRTRLAQRGTGS